jgi:hypothetical protein
MTWGTRQTERHRGKKPQHRKTQAYPLSWSSLNPLRDSKSPFFSLAYSDPLSEIQQTDIAGGTGVPDIKANKYLFLPMQKPT